MQEKILPNYQDGSIINLMSSIVESFNGKIGYNHLKILKPSELKSYDNLVLILVDGLGYEYLLKHGKGSILNKHLRGNMTSVFPSATSAAIPAISTGLSPQEHEMTSWFAFLKELGCVIIPLPYVTRVKPRAPIKEPISNLFTLTPIADKIKAQSYLVTMNEIVDSEFTNATAGNSKKLAYRDLAGCFKETKKAIKSSKKRKFIFTYYGEHDHLCHEHGIESKKATAHFKQFNKELSKFIKSIKGTNTAIIITADHGEIDVPKNKKIKIKDHPKLAETLTLPICGDNRYAYCFVHSSKKEQFEHYVKNKLNYCCELHKSLDLVKKNYFGLGNPSKRFIERIGDYTIIMKENYAIYQKLAGEEEHYNISEHGGLSKQEMLVPLILIDSNTLD
jgi:predicted AlkP superfamily pyrophosphatase or phosphodiesterase